MSGEEPRAPGWYPDPWGGEGERYFDGTSWSRDNLHALPDPFATRSRSWIGWLIGGVVALGVVAAIAVVALGGSSSSSHAAAPSTTASSLAPSTTTTTGPHTLMLQAYDKGDCATWDQDVPDAPATLVKCAKPHLIELVAPEHVPASFHRYPTPPEWDLIDASVCAPVVESYLGSKLDPDGRYHASSIAPTEVGWSQGDRDLACGIILRGDSHRLVPFTGKVDPAAQYQAMAPGTCLPNGDAGRLGDAVPCNQPHVIEVAGAVDLTGSIDHAPSADEMRRLVDADCERVATAYLGRAPSGGIQSGWFDIDAASWAAGHRITECTLGQYGGDNVPVVLNAPLRAG
jgi:hypothetical protein